MEEWREHGSRVARSSCEADVVAVVASVCGCS